MKHLNITRCLLTALLLIPISLSAQKKQGQARLDSLLAEVPKMKEDTNGVDLLSGIAVQYTNISPDDGLQWATRELALARRIGFRKGEAWAYNDLGINHQKKGDLPASLDAYYKALSIQEALGNEKNVGAISGNIGNVYKSQKNYPKALDYLNKSLNTARQLGNLHGVHLGLGNIGIVYLAEGKYAEALDYAKQALAIAYEINETQGILLHTANIGTIYSDMGQYSEAIKYLSDGLRMCREAGDMQGVAAALGNMGCTYYAMAKASGQPARAGMLAKSIEYLQQSITACRETQLLEAIPEFSGNLADALIAQGNYKGAMAAYKQSIAVKDSLYNTANNEKIAHLETKRAVELKNKDIEIEKLKKRNERILVAGGFAVLLLILAILFRNFKKQQHSNILLAKEKKRSDDLLLNILPAEVAEELKDNGASAARQYEEVSVLFTDFVDFTGTAEKLGPQQLVQELNECFTAFDAIIERNGLEKIKTIGDAYMAVCGLPVSDPRHAQKAVQAAIEIGDFIENRKMNEQAFEIRIGINSGPVVAGIIGVKKFAYDIWGDTVNTAARMEQHGEAGRINISETTFELVKDEFECTRRGKIPAKHKGEVEMYFVNASNTIQ